MDCHVWKSFQFNFALTGASVLQNPVQASSKINGYISVIHACIHILKIKWLQVLIKIVMLAAW